MIELLTLLIGLVGGFYARSLFDYVKRIYELLADKFDSHKAGVVTPQVSRVTRGQPISLESETGGVTRPSPNQVALDAMKVREERIKQVTP